MMISRAQISQVLRVYKSQGSSSPAGKLQKLSLQSSGDRINLSFTQDDVSLVKEIVESVPDIRMDKVQSIAERVASGTYSVDPVEIADKILGRLLADRIR